MRAGVEKRAQPFRRQRDCVRRGDADGVKTLRAGEVFERRLEGRQI
jgi:hypothetical protein